MMQIEQSSKQSKRLSDQPPFMLQRYGQARRTFVKKSRRALGVQANIDRLRRKGGGEREGG